MYLFFDTETNGLPKDNKASHTDVDNWPRLVSIAWVLCDSERNVVEEKSFIVKPDGWTIPKSLTDHVHGISTEHVEKVGTSIVDVLREFVSALFKTKYVIGHNIRFDRKVVASELYRYYYGSHYDELLYGTRYRDTMHISRNYVGVKNKKGLIKFPKLQEMYEKLFGKKFTHAHTATADVNATVESFWKLDELELVEEYYS